MVTREAVFCGIRNNEIAEKRNRKIIFKAFAIVYSLYSILIIYIPHLVAILRQSLIERTQNCLLQNNLTQLNCYPINLNIIVRK